MHLSEGIHDDAWRRDAGEEVHVAALDEWVKELNHKAVHVSHGKHVDQAVAGFQEFEIVNGKLHVAPDAAVAEHHAL